MKKYSFKTVALLSALLSISPALGMVASADTVPSYETPANVTFQAGQGPVDPVDPTNPEVPVDPVDPDGNKSQPGTSGSLSLDFASSLSFGKQAISVNDKTYYAHAQALSDGTTRPDYAQVTDQRGTFAGWTLSVNTDSQFHLAGVTTPEASDTTPGDYLTGAELVFNGGYVAGTTQAGTPSTVKQGAYTVSDAATPILAAKANEGAGTWVYGLGSGTSGNTQDVLSANNAAYQENGGAPLASDAVSTQSPITLTVPGSTVKKADAYTTNLIWTLSDTPAN